MGEGGGKTTKEKENSSEKELQRKEGLHSTAASSKNIFFIPISFGQCPKKNYASLFGPLKKGDIVLSGV